MRSFFRQAARPLMKKANSFLPMQTLILMASLVGLLMLNGCETSPVVSGEGATAVTVPLSAAGEGASASGGDAFMDVHSGQVFAAADHPLPKKGGYVLGQVQEDGTFAPDGHVQGEYPCVCGGIRYLGPYTKGWLDVSTGKFFAEDSGQTKRRPYIVGLQHENGRFTPDSRAVLF